MGWINRTHIDSGWRRTALYVSAVLLGLCVPVYAQQQETPQIRALNMRLGNEITGNLQCTTGAITLQDKLATVEAEVKRLTDKYEPKSDKP